LLDGEPGAYRDIVALNTGAALLVADIVPDLGQGIAKAKAALDDGHAKLALSKLVAVSNQS
jgi:anthranilate phosphoribosyltransferase